MMCILSWLSYDYLVSNTSYLLHNTVVNEFEMYTIIRSCIIQRVSSYYVICILYY